MDEWKDFIIGRDWKIIVRFKQDGREAEHDFKSISSLATYLRFVPDRGSQLGYGKPPDGRTAYGASTDVRLLLWYKDGEQEITAEFTNVHAFARFMDHNPTIAKCISYTKKNKPI